MPYDSKAQHIFSDVYLPNYEFGIFTGNTQIPLRRLRVVKPVGEPPEFVMVALHATNVQLDLPGDSGDGFGVPTQDSIYTKIDQYPYLLRDSYTTGADEYTGGPGFIYSLQQSAAGYYGEGAFIDVMTRAGLTEGAEGGGLATGRRFIIRALDAGVYPTLVGPELKLSYNYKIMKEGGAAGLGYTVSDEMTKIQSFYLSCMPQMTKVLTDCVYPEQWDSSLGTGDVGKFGETYKIRALNFFAQTGRNPARADSGGTANYKPFEDIVKSSTFIATGLPFFDKYGFMNIKDGDFTHLQSNRAAGAQNNGAGYQTIDREVTSMNNLLNLLAGGAGISFDEKKYAGNYYWSSDYPSKKARQDFQNYFRGNGDRFRYGYLDDPTLVDEEGSATGLMRLLDKSLHYRFDPSCVPYTSFRIHYDLKNADISLAAIDLWEVYHPAYKDHALYAGDARAAEYVASFAATTGGSYAYKYNLESAICGRLPPVFTLEAKLNSEEIVESTVRTNDRLQMHAASYDEHGANVELTGDGGLSLYTSLEKKLLKGNLYLKSCFPFPWDGDQRIQTFGLAAGRLGATGALYPYNIMTPSVGDGSDMDAWREYYENLKDLGWDSMAWSHDPGSYFYGRNEFNLAYSRYKASLRVFFGTREMNAINCFHSLKRHVDKLAGSWTYDAEQKESRIRMQKRLPFKKSDFTSISEGYSDSEVEGTAITLDDEPVTTSDTAVLPDDMGGAGGVY